LEKGISKLYEGNDSFFTEQHSIKEAESYFNPEQFSFNWFYTDFVVSAEAKM